MSHDFSARPMPPSSALIMLHVGHKTWKTFHLLNACMPKAWSTNASATLNLFLETKKISENFFQLPECITSKLAIKIQSSFFKLT